MVAPSFVTVILPSVIDARILSIPFGPSVVFTRSPTAIAPMNDDKRADSARSSVAFAGRSWMGCIVALKTLVSFCGRGGGGEEYHFFL